jgi:uncharacterized membrane protein SirB2
MLLGFICKKILLLVVVTMGTFVIRVIMLLSPRENKYKIKFKKIIPGSSYCNLIKL